MEDLIFDQPTYSEYMDDLNYSQGFYVTRPEDGSVLLGGIRRVEEYSDERYRKAERAAKFAVEEHNKKVVGGGKGFLQFGKIVNLNVEPTAGTIYYITMSASEAEGLGESRLYQLKIWEKRNSGYQLQIFRPAPYCLQLPEEQLANRIGITGLMPWMDENYLYYKCFSAASKVLRVQVDRESRLGYIWLRDSAHIEEMVNKYEGAKMPHSNVFYAFDSN